MSRFVWNFGCDWRQFARFRDWNWINVALVQLEPEWDRSLGSVSVSAALLGFRAEVSFTYDPATPLREELRAKLDDWNDGVFVTVPKDEFMAYAAWRDSQKPGMEAAP